MDKNIKTYNISFDYKSKCVRITKIFEDTFMPNNSSNASRFIKAYNTIDLALRMQGEMKRSLSYTEAVRRAARTNSIVRKYEEKLVDYGRLRNAIVHNSNDQVAIAEPYIEVVEEYEKIAKLITTPPLAIDTVCVKDVKCVDHTLPLKDVLAYMYKTGFSNLPVYKDGMLVGIANSARIGRAIGHKIYEKVDINRYLETPIEIVVKEFAQDNFYTIVNKSVTLDMILNLFTENRKLSIVLITPTGSLLETPIGVITVGDILDINKVLEDYD